MHFEVTETLPILQYQDILECFDGHMILSYDVLCSLFAQYPFISSKNKKKKTYFTEQV